VLDGDLRGLLESGCSLIVGLLDPAGGPFATRAWGVDVLDAEQGTARVLVGAGDLARLGRSAADLAGSPVAMTGADVQTFRSVQVKGVVERVEEATAADRARAERHKDGFFSAVEVVDFTPREVLERMVPVDVTPLLIRVTEAYDQTPGPGAGAPLRGSA
jgi:hypothetical protein